MGTMGGEVTRLEELLKKALDEIVVLKAEIASLKQENAILRDEIAVLKKNSANSSKPPSSDIVNGLYPVRYTRLSDLSQIKHIRRTVVKRRMHTNAVIVRLNVHKDRLPDLCLRMPAVQGFQFRFERFEK